MSTTPASVPALAGATITPVHLEAEFRARTLAEDARTLRVLMVGITILFLTFVRADLIFLAGRPSLGWLLGLRALHVLATAAAVVALGRVRAARALDAIGLAWLLVTSTLVLAVLATRPPDHVLPILLGTLMVAGFWAMIPIRFAFQGAAAAVALLVEVLNLALFRDPLPSTSVTLVAGGLGSAFLGGGWVSWRLHRARRTAFLDLKGAEAARDALARALAEARTLRGLIPICAGCKAMKAPDGSWHELEEVLSQRTEAEFTHGLCDRCVDKLYPVR